MEGITATEQLINKVWRYIIVVPQFVHLYEKIIIVVPRFVHLYEEIILYLERVDCSWLAGCFGFNGPLRKYFSLYRAVSQREGERSEKG